MAQATNYVIDNGTGAAVRAAMNVLNLAIVSGNSGATEPTTKYAYMPWADTTALIFKQRNAANTAWEDLFSIAPASFGQPLKALLPYTTAGSSTAYTLTPSPAITAYANNRFRVSFHVTAGVNPQISVSGVGNVNIKLYDSTGAKVAASATTIIAGMESDILHDGTDFVLLNPLPSGGAGGYEFASSQTISASATAIFTGSELGYDYLYKLIKIVPVNDGDTLQAELGIGGGTWRSSGYINRISTLMGSAPLAATNKNNGRINFNWARSQGNLSTEFLQGSLELIDPVATSSTTFNSDNSYEDVSSLAAWVDSSGEYTAAESHPDIKFDYSSTGNFSGIIVQYRRANT